MRHIMHQILYQAIYRFHLEKFWQKPWNGMLHCQYFLFRSYIKVNCKNLVCEGEWNADSNNERCRSSVGKTDFQHLCCCKLAAIYKYFRIIFRSIAIETIKGDHLVWAIQIKIKILKVIFSLNVTNFILKYLHKSTYLKIFKSRINLYLKYASDINIERFVRDRNK